MKRLVEIIFLLMVAQASYAEESDISFVVTSDCVTSIEVNKSKHGYGWNLTVTLNKEAADTLFELSSNNVGSTLTIYDGNNSVVITAIVREPLPQSFATSGIDSEDEALKIKRSLLESTGKCGANQP